MSSLTDLIYNAIAKPGGVLGEPHPVQGGKKATKRCERPLYADAEATIVVVNTADRLRDRFTWGALLWVRWQLPVQNVTLNAHPEWRVVDVGGPQASRWLWLALRGGFIVIFTATSKRQLERRRDLSAFLRHWALKPWPPPSSIRPERHLAGCSSDVVNTSHIQTGTRHNRNGDDEIWVEIGERRQNPGYNLQVLPGKAQTVSI